MMGIISRMGNYCSERSFARINDDLSFEEGSDEDSAQPYRRIEAGSLNQALGNPYYPISNEENESESERANNGIAPLRENDYANSCKSAWTTVLPLLYGLSAGIIGANAAKWDNRQVEMLSAAGLGATLRIYSHYCSSGKIARWAPPFFASVAAEGLFALTNFYLNLDDISQEGRLLSGYEEALKTLVRSITYASTAFFVTHNILAKPKELPSQDSDLRTRLLILGRSANKVILAVHYLALFSLGAALIVTSQQMPENSRKILHLDFDAGILTLSYTAANFIFRCGLKAHDWSLENNSSYRGYFQGLDREPTALKNRILILARRTLETFSGVLPGFLFPLNASLSYGALGCLGAATRVLQERSYERLHSYTRVTPLEITARKAEYVKTGVLSIALLAFTIACMMTNDWHTGSAMLTLGLTSVGGYLSSKAVELLISQRNLDNRVINQLDFELNVNSYGILFLYLFLHTKFMLLNSDVDVSSGFKYALLLSMYGLLGFNLGNNRARFGSVHNLNPENASSFALAQAANNCMEYRNSH
ncbi:Uncharacterized protein NEOC65_001767 [Neochlamydia sp. AcF65]|nr:Uncharacterized protein [Neochlamydia sp. AcF65]